MWLKAHVQLIDNAAEPGPPSRIVCFVVLSDFRHTCTPSRKSSSTKEVQAWQGPTPAKTKKASGVDIQRNTRKSRFIPICALGGMGLFLSRMPRLVCPDTDFTTLQYSGFEAGFCGFDVRSLHQRLRQLSLNSESRLVRI